MANYNPNQRRHAAAKQYQLEHDDVVSAVDRSQRLMFEDVKVAFRQKGLTLFRVNNAESLAAYGVQLPGENFPRGFKNLWAAMDFLPRVTNYNDLVEIAVTPKVPKPFIFPRLANVGIIVGLGDTPPIAVVRMDNLPHPGDTFDLVLGGEVRLYKVIFRRFNLPRNRGCDVFLFCSVEDLKPPLRPTSTDPLTTEPQP